MDPSSFLAPRSFDLEVAIHLLKDAPLQGEPIALVPLNGGANNRVFKLELRNAPPLLLKSYFQHPQDNRPRLQAEFEFLSFAWSEGVRAIPEPLFQHPNENLALYSYLDARLATAIHSTQDFVNQALDFLLAINRNKKLGKHLPYASEACLKTSDFIDTVEKKLGRLLKTPQTNRLEIKLHEFLKKELLPLWEALREDRCKTALHGLDGSPEDWIITPSDFGLHNTLVSDSNRYFFIDFEYAGWDDPAKTICDFFLQPKIPINPAYFKTFAQSIATLSANPEKTLNRTRKMMEICKIKWCCIILNVFLDLDKARRSFANTDPIQAQEEKLILAQKYLNKALIID